MKRIYVEEKWCLGCHLCEYNCAFANSGMDDMVKALKVCDRDQCVGCYTCILVCPYGCILPTEEGPVQKCELCMNSRPGKPACVEGCPNRAIVYEER